MTPTGHKARGLFSASTLGNEATPLLKQERLPSFFDLWDRDISRRFLLSLLACSLALFATNYVARRLRICYRSAVCRVSNSFADYIVDAILCLVF